MTPVFLAEIFAVEFKANPNMPIRALQKKAIKEFNMSDGS